MVSRFLVLLCLLSAPAFAGPGEDAFREGRFAEAQKLGEAAGDANGLALAARATLAIAAYQTRDRAQAERLIDEALADAKAARAQNPKHVEALLQQAIGVAYRAKLRQSPSQAREARKLMENALKLAPDNAFAWASLAGWHGEAVADLGGFVAGTVLGARKAEALRLYEEALRRDTASPTFPTFFAVTLLRLDRDQTARARSLLQSALEKPARDGFEALMRQHAAQVLSALQSGDSKKTLALVKRLQPFGEILAR
jgi:tetratricopeptide (TPR) repeat protein